MKISYNLNRKSHSKWRGKLSIQVPKLGKKYSKKVKVIAQMFGKKGILKKFKNSQENSTVTSKGVFQNL